MLFRWFLASNIDIKGRYVEVRITCQIEIIDLQLLAQLGDILIDIGCDYKCFFVAKNYFF